MPLFPKFLILQSGGDMAFTAQTYRTELQKELAANSLIGGDRIFFGADRNRDLTTFDWVDNDFFTLARYLSIAFLHLRSALAKPTCHLWYV